MTTALIVAEVGPGVWRIQVPLAFLEPNEVSLYLLRTDEGDILFDAAMAGSEDAVDAGLRLAGSDPSEVVRVIVSHEHPDHLGSAGRFGVPVMMHPLTKRLVERFEQQDPTRFTVFIDRLWLDPSDIPDPSMFDHFRAMLSWPERVEAIEDGDYIAGGWRVVWTPGHSPGHICLYSAERKTLLAGDHVLPGYTPHVGMDPFNEDPVGAFVESLLKVAGYDVDLVLPSHGEPFTDMRAKVDALTEHHARRLEQIEAEVREPRTVREVTDAVFRSCESPIDSMMATLEAAAHLVHLELIGKVRRIDGRRWVGNRTDRVPAGPPRGVT